MAYITFLLLFCYTILCDFTYSELVFIDQIVTSNITNSSKIIHIPKTIFKKPDWVECLLIFWVFSFISEEIRQVIKVFLGHFKHITSQLCG